MSTPVREIGQERYLDAVEHLLAGRPEEAVHLLEVVPPDQRSDEIWLAIAKGYLQLRQGRVAGEILDPLRTGAGPETPVGVRAYLSLLSAWAAALDDRPEEVERRLAEVTAIDPRMEHAAGDLRRRMERGRPPGFRF